MLTPEEWYNGVMYLKHGELGDFIENGLRCAEVAEMCGGRYLLTVNGEVAGLTDSPEEALLFLLNSSNEDFKEAYPN